MKKIKKTRGYGVYLGKARDGSQQRWESGTCLIRRGEFLRLRRGGWGGRSCVFVRSQAHEFKLCGEIRAMRWLLCLRQRCFKRYRMMVRVCHAFSNNGTPHNTRKQMQSRAILDGGCFDWESGGARRGCVLGVCRASCAMRALPRCDVIDSESFDSHINSSCSTLISSNKTIILFLNWFDSWLCSSGERCWTMCPHRDSGSG